MPSTAPARRTRRAGAARVPATLLGLVLVLVLVACSSPSEPSASTGATGSTAAPVTAGTGGGSTVPSPSSRTTPGTRAVPERPGGTSVDPVSLPDPADEPAPEPLRWTPCGEVECATLTVPLDASTGARADGGDGEGRKVLLSVARRPAADPSKRIGSVFVNPGGPGASGVAYLKSSPFGGTLNERFDIVSWDPRGVGESTPLDCGEDLEGYRRLDWNPDDEDERRRLDDAAFAIADACGRSEGDVLTHVATEDTVADLDRLRRAVGDEQLTFIGFSYGTAIGLRYAERFPGRVRAMVLDGVVDPTEDVGASLVGQTEALERELDERFAACAAQPGSCPLDDPAAAYDRLAARAEQAPLPAERGDDVGPTALAFAAVSSSYDESLWQVFLQGLADADADGSGRGDASDIAEVAASYFSGGGYTAYLAVLCADSTHPIEDGWDDLEAELARRSPRFGAAVANEMRPCAWWPAPVTGSSAAVRAAGSAPILVVGNTGDVATPYASAQEVARTLERGVLLTYRGEGHTSYGKDSCVDAAVNRYLTTLATPPAEQVCD